MAGTTFGRFAAAIPVSDIGRALAFYQDILGMTVTFTNGDPTGFVILRRDAAELHLTLVRGHRAGLHNVAHLMVTDATALHDHLVASGARIVKGLRDADYGLRGFVMADPDGNRIDVGQRLLPALHVPLARSDRSGGGRQRPRAVDALELSTKAVAEAVRRSGLDFDLVNDIVMARGHRGHGPGGGRRRPVQLHRPEDQPAGTQDRCLGRGLARDQPRETPDAPIRDMTITLTHELRRRGGTGAAAMCADGGMATA
jgi:catechol 2,3-dioxygenase-like lactoylglutathione lyase family enzyme